MGTTARSHRPRRSLFGPIVYGVAVLLFRAALVVAALCSAYLLLGLFSGQLSNYPSLPKADRTRIFDNILLAGNLLNYSVAVSALLAAYLFFYEEITGYILGLTALVLYAGIPYAVLFLGASPNVATRHALVAFPQAVWSLAICGGGLIIRDVILRLTDALQEKTLQRDLLQYGGDAQPEAAKPRPIRLGLLGKCWEGPFCREFVRVYCPIFLARKCCWREKRGCYCEADIVNNAASRMSGIQLSMAPDARYNFANDPVPGARKKADLTPAQKRERCRHCVIYNEHQRRKYSVLLPVVIGGIALLCFVGAPVLRGYLGLGLAGLETVMQRFSFSDTTSGISWKFGRPSPTVEWIFIGSFMLMLVSKALQTLEWAIFKLKV